MENVGYCPKCKRQTGAVISRISQDTSSLQEFLAFDVQFIISNSLILVLVLLIMFQQNWQLAALTVLPAPKENASNPS